MSYHVLVEKAYRVCALSEVGKDWGVTCPAVDFLKAKAQQSAYSSSASGLAVTMGRYAENGRHGVTAEMFHEVDSANGIWQFSRGDLRILCFVEGNTVYLTNGYIKKSQKADPAEVARAVAAKRRWQQV